MFQAAYEALQQETDGQRMVAAARRLSQVTAQMIADVKTQAETIEGDPDRQTRLFSAAKQLADATTDLINQAKVCRLLSFRQSFFPKIMLQIRIGRTFLRYERDLFPQINTPGRV